MTAPRIARAGHAGSDHRAARRAALALAIGLPLLLPGCGGGDSPSEVRAPGREESPRTQALDPGAAVLQAKPPIDAINSYVDGFHFYSGRLDEQMEAHHYCSNLNEDVTQCAIYDGNTRQAKLMGVEYIISGALFATLPADEKQLWHSHVYEVKSGQLIGPGLPDAAEHALMRKLVGTYGKTWHTWHTDREARLPLGTPQLMMGFTADGQIDMAMVSARDQRMGVSTAAKRDARADLPAPPIDPAANAWERGEAYQLPGLGGHHTP